MKQEAKICSLKASQKITSDLLLKILLLNDKERNENFVIMETYLIVFHVPNYSMFPNPKKIINILAVLKLRIISKQF